MVTGVNEINLTSESVVGGKIDKIHACRQKGGKDKSIQISASNLPADTKSVSIILDDPDAIKPAGKVWVHWNVFNIPVNTSEFTLDVGTKPAGTIGKGHGGSGYKGMCPLMESIHTELLSMPRKKMSKQRQQDLAQLNIR